MEMALLADGVAPGDVYRTLETPEGLTRAFAKLKVLNPIWAHDSVGALEWLKDGQAVMVTALNGDVANLKGFTPGVVWDHQLYEMDVFGIPAGDPNRQGRWITSPMPRAAHHWRAWRAGCLTGLRGAPRCRWSRPIPRPARRWPRCCRPRRRISGCLRR